MSLCIIVTTNDLNKEIHPPKYQPKVCYSLGDKTILEVCLDHLVQLNPKRIILMVSKNEIQPINRVLKYLSYAKLISYCIFDQERLKDTSKDASKDASKSVSKDTSKSAFKDTSKSAFKNASKDASKYGLAKTCYEGHNVLVVSGNTPLLNSHSLYNLISRRQSLRVNRNTFYLLADDLDKIDHSEQLPIAVNIIPEAELEELNTREQYERVREIFQKPPSLGKRAKMKWQSVFRKK